MISFSAAGACLERFQTFRRARHDARVNIAVLLIGAVYMLGRCFFEMGKQDLPLPPH